MTMPDWSEIEVLILAAGLGTRMRPITYDTPKALVKILGVPLIYWRLFDLSRAGVKTISMNSHHLSSVLISQVTTMAGKLGLQIDFFNEDILLDSGGGLNNILSKIKSAKKYALVFNADNLVSIDYNTVCNFKSIENVSVCLVASDNWPHINQYKNIYADENNLLVQVEAQKSKIRPYHFYGIQWLKVDSFLDAVSAAGFFGAFSLFDLYKHDVLRNKIRISPLGVNFWQDCGNVEDLFGLHWQILQDLVLLKDTSIFWAAWQDYYTKMRRELPQIDSKYFNVIDRKSQVTLETLSRASWTYWGPNSSGPADRLLTMAIVEEDEKALSSGPGKREFWYQNKNMIT